MDDSGIRDAYAARATEYTSLFGTIDDMEPADIARIDAWASDLAGHVLDAGCGPGHWTGRLARHGLRARGVDLVPAFVAEAAARFPECPFEVASIERLPFEDDTFEGVLAWYSLIHLEPARLVRVLTELRRVVRPGGVLLTGFFTGERPEPFAHGVTTAYVWPIDEFVRRLGESGFAVDDHETRIRPGKRPHASIRGHRPESDGTRDSDRAVPPGPTSSTP